MTSTIELAFEWEKSFTETVPLDVGIVKFPIGQFWLGLCAR
jgi:hypothetical protein